MVVESLFSLLFDGYFTMGPHSVEVSSRGHSFPRQDQSSDVQCKAEASELPEADAKGLEMEMEQNASWPHGQ